MNANIKEIVGPINSWGEERTPGGVIFKKMLERRIEISRRNLGLVGMGLGVSEVGQVENVLSRENIAGLYKTVCFQYT